MLRQAGSSSAGQVLQCTSPSGCSFHACLTTRDRNVPIMPYYKALHVYGFVVFLFSLHLVLRSSASMLVNLRDMFTGAKWLNKPQCLGRRHHHQTAVTSKKHTVLLPQVACTGPTGHFAVKYRLQATTASGQCSACCSFCHAAVEAKVPPRRAQPLEMTPALSLKT